MTRSLLILMLVTTQLAAAGRASLYVCINDDGEYCCLDAGPDSCNCCHDEEEPGQDACCEHEHSAAPSPHHSDEPAQPSDGVVVAADGCDCTHIPVVTSSAEARNAVRPSLPFSVATSFYFVALPPTLSDIGDTIARPPSRWADPPAVPNLTQTVLSTVVIRC